MFHNDTRVKYTHLDFPVKGYRYYINIKKHFKTVKYFTKVYFNQEYPVQQKTIRFEIPTWLNVELKELNFEGYDIKKTTSKTEKKDHTTHTYTLKNVDALYDESNKPGPTYIYPHILILPKTYSKNGETANIFNSTEDLYSWYKSLVDQLENDTKPIKAKVLELTENAASDEEKIKNIYYWVQDNIRYIAFEDGIAGFKPDEAANVYNKRYGDCKGMANLIKHMLAEAGFDARLTWIGTKHIAYDYSTPNLSVDNHMICTLFKDGKTIFLDGTEKYNAFGEYAERIQGKQALIENGEEFILKEVPYVDDSFNKEAINYDLKLNNEEITGKALRSYKGESRSAILYQLNSLKTNHKEDFIEWFLNKGNSNISVSNIETSDINKRDNDLTINYNIVIKNAVSEFDGSIYVDLDIDKQLADFQFNDRKTDYIFTSKKNLTSITKLHIPNY